MDRAPQSSDRALPVFDQALATAPVRVVDAAAVVDLLPVTHAPERIATYRQAMQRGDAFPPIAVVPLAGRYLIADGHKRFTAYAAWQADTILVEVWSLRRWARDQWQQFTRKTRQQARVAIRSLVDRGARREAAQLLRDTLAHWQRIGRSVAWHLSRSGHRQ